MKIKKRQARLAAVAFAGCAALYFLWMARAGLYPFALGILLAYLLNPLVALLERKGMKRRTGLFLLYGLIFFLFWVIGVKFIPLLVQELENFARDLPKIIERIEVLLNYWQSSYESIALPLSMREAINAEIAGISARLNLFVMQLVQGILEMISYCLGIAISPILAFYLLDDWQAIKKSMLQIVPAGWQKEVFLLSRSIQKVLNGVIRGQLFISLFVAAFITAGLWLMGIKYALLIGVLAGILDIIPYFGAIVGAFPAIGVAFLYSPVAAFKVAALFFAVHQLESVLIQPKIVGAKVGLHPLSVIFFVFIGGELGGLAGMLLCVPAAAVGKATLRHFLKMAMSFKEAGDR